MFMNKVFRDFKKIKNYCIEPFRMKAIVDKTTKTYVIEFYHWCNL